jgi:hypothetical protein
MYVAASFGLKTKRKCYKRKIFVGTDHEPKYANQFKGFLRFSRINMGFIFGLFFLSSFEKVDFEKEGHPQNSLTAVSGIKRRAGQVFVRRRYLENETIR